MSPLRAAVALCLCQAGAAVAMPALFCAGQDPDWTLALAADQATFAFAGRTSDMTIPQMSQPRGADWPMAMTLIAPRDSAIVILEAPADPQPIRILTQRGETPLLLVGSCQPDD